MAKKPFSELTKNFSPERLARVRAKAEALKTGATINRLRTEAGLTQAELAQRLGITQQAVSKMEWGEEIQVGTFRRVIAALGCELVVHTPNGQISLSTDQVSAAG